MTDPTTTPGPQTAGPGSMAYYVRLREHLAELDGPLVPVADRDVREQCEALLVREARLLDEGRLEDWLELCAPSCLYWIPMTPGGGDPATEVTHAFDDRRRLEDRVAWLRSAYIWSQIPRSRTRRMLTNVEVLATADPDEVLVRSNVVIHDVRPGYGATFPGWYAHRLRRSGDAWLIELKQTNLLDADQAHQNLSIIF